MMPIDPVTGGTHMIILLLLRLPLAMTMLLRPPMLAPVAGLQQMMNVPLRRNLLLQTDLVPQTLLRVPVVRANAEKKNEQIGQMSLQIGQMTLTKVNLVQRLICGRSTTSHTRQKSTPRRFG